MITASRSVRPNFIGMSSAELEELKSFYRLQPDEAPLEEGARPILVHDFLSPYKPIGYDTPMGYLAKHDPVVLSFMDDEPAAFDEDERLLRRECLTLNMRRVEVPSCPWMAREGIFTTWAYPVRLLRRHFRT